MSDILQGHTDSSKAVTILQAATEAWDLEIMKMCLLRGAKPTDKVCSDLDDRNKQANTN